MNSKKLISLLFIFFYCFNINGQDVYEISVKFPVHNLERHLLIYEENENENSPLDILKKPNYEFKKRDQFPRNLNPDKHYWGKISLQTQDSLLNWYLNFEDRWIGPPAWNKSNGKVDVYGFVNDNLIFHKKTGVNYSPQERDVKSSWVLNKVSLSELPVNTTVDFVIHIVGNDFGMPPYFNLTARSPDQRYYHKIYHFNDSFNIFMFGVTFIIFLYHLLQYLYLKDKVILWFTTWLFFVMITHAMAIGLIIGKISQYRLIFWLLFANGIFYTFWYFGRSFINSKTKFPKTDLAIIIFTSLVVLEIFAILIYIVFFNGKARFGMIGIHFEMMLFYTICSSIISIILCFKKDLFARYFGIGSVIGSLFLIIGNLWSLGIIGFPLNFMDPYATGMFLQIVIYSFGIAYRKQVLDKTFQKEILAAQETKAEIERIKDLDEIKTRFFANISHEFKTPLTLIKGPLKRAIKSMHSDEDSISLSKKSLDVITNNTERLQKLIDQLLELSKIESGAIYLQLKHGKLISFLRSKVELFEGMAERKNISLRCSYPEEFDQAVYDEDKLEKIVSNLLSNAIKFTPKGGSVTVAINHDNRFLTMEITDSGKGIDETEISKIFDRFYRGESNEATGTGIGLSLTKEMVDLHGGKINVSSTKKVGTKFKVVLPITIKDLPRTNNLAILEEDTMAEKESGIPMSESIHDENLTKEENHDKPVVLIVEDNRELIDFIEEILEGQYSILKAEDGQVGEEIALEKIPDVVISDVMMPKKNGYELCHALKSNDKTNHIPVIMLTAKGEQEHKMEGLQQGANAYLTKPFDDDELIITIKNLIESRDNLWQHFKSMDMFLVNEMDINTLEDKFLQEVFQIIKENMDNENFKVDDIAYKVGFSRSQLHRKLKALLDKSANQLIVEIRMNEAYRLLKSRANTVSQVAYSVGYSNLSYFTKRFKEKFGVLPSMVE